MDLISKQGPLSHVWLAANYDKKLTKQQLLNTNLLKSTKYIEDHPIETTDNSSITLRLSGQLLLGIVKIYSRKTKYLLDDVNDILYKLKSSFKLAMKTTTDHNVNLNPQQTIMNLSSVMLKDQVTSMDLLHQEDLDLSVPASNLGGMLSQATQPDTTFDQSMEFPRYEEPQMDDNFDLDFDLDMDVEEGRRDDSMIDDREQSIIDLHQKDSIFDIDFGEPLETFEIDQEEGQQEAIPLPSPPPRPQPQPRQKRTRNDMNTNYRRLVVDTEIDISVQELRDNQVDLMNNEPVITISLTNKEKLESLKELSAPKRRKLFNIDEELQTRCYEIAEEEPEIDNFDQSLDFDLSLPDLEPEQVHELEPEHIQDHYESEEEDTDKNHATIQIAHDLTNIFNSKQQTNVSEIIQQDNQTKSPLGSKDNKMNPKKQAARCFFELLVLATNDCITIDQDIIKPRDKLYNFI